MNKKQKITRLHRKHTKVRAKIFLTGILIIVIFLAIIHFLS
jgi:hypothetical protein